MTQPRDFGFGTEAQMLKNESRKFFKDHCSPIALLDQLTQNPEQVDHAPNVWDEAIWEKMKTLEWAALAVPERAQGVAMSAVSVAALLEEHGRAACPSPLLTTINAVYLLDACQTPAADGLLREIAAGKCASLALMDHHGRWKESDAPVKVIPTANGARVTGTAWFVQNAHKVDYFIVRCLFAEGHGMIAIPKGTRGVTIMDDTIVDLTRDQAHIDFSDVALCPEWVLTGPGCGDEAVQKAEAPIFTMIAADMVGAGEWQLQTTAQYAKTRVQFDRPLGFFQAVKHPIVNMMLKVDEAKSLVYNAACAMDHEPAQCLADAHMAKASASDMAFFCSGRSVQLHGGMGFTWENPVQVYFKRQMHHSTLFGDARYHRSCLADLVIGKTK